MLIPIEVLPTFLRLIEDSFDIKIMERDQSIINKTGEYARFMITDNLFVVRKQDDTVGSPRLIEVWASDLDLLKSVDEMWYMWLQKDMLEGLKNE